MNSTKSLIILSLGLSSNPNTPVADDPTLGKVNVTKDGRHFLILKVFDKRNPLAGIKQRIVAQAFNTLGNPVWNIPVDIMQTMIGQDIDGSIVRRDVFPYEVKSIRAGKEVVNQATSFTTVVFGNEVEDTVFHNNGHRLVKGYNEAGVPNYEPLAVLPPRFQTGAKPVVVEEAEAEEVEHAPHALDQK